MDQASHTKAIMFLSAAIILTNISIYFMQKAMKTQDDMMDRQDKRISLMEETYKKAVADKAEEQ